MEVIYNNSQYQNIKSLLCGYYCLYFLHQACVHKKSFYDILKPFFLTDTMYNVYNEQFISNNYLTNYI